MRKVLVGVLVLAGISMLGYGCKKKADVVVKVGDESVTTQEFVDRMREASYYYSREFLDTENGKNQILDGIVKEYVIAETARNEGIDKTPEFKNQVKNFENQILVTDLIRNLKDTVLKVTDQEVEDAYNANKAYYDHPEELKVAHILVLDEATAEEVLAKINDGEDFAVLASSYSLDRVSARNGGELDWFGLGDMVPAFEKAAFALKNDGDVSGIVQTQFGYHIIKRLAAREIPPITLDDVSLKLRKTLEKNKFDQWFEDQKSKIKVSVNKPVLDKISLEESAE